MNEYSLAKVQFYHLNIDIVYFFSELVYFFIAKF